jgi:hypothetical protein
MYGHPPFNWVWGNMQQEPPRSRGHVDALANAAIGQVGGR